MTPECASAWRNYECKVNVTGYERRTQDAFVAGWQEGWAQRGIDDKTTVQVTIKPPPEMIDGPAIDFSAPAPLVGHVCEAFLTGRTPSEPAPVGHSLCWIGATQGVTVSSGIPWQVAFAKWNACNTVTQPPAYTYFCGWKESASLVKAIVQSWLAKQGHARCWYYPELFNQLAAALGLKATIAPALPLQAEFAEGCKRYQAEQYGALMPVTHGPPLNLGAAIETTIAEDANRLASTGRKWPIGTASQDMYTGLTWGTRLAAARIHRGLTLDALARRLDPPRTRKDISAMEHGRRGLSVELCAQLADALDCDRLWLAGW